MKSLLAVKALRRMLQWVAGGTGWVGVVAGAAIINVSPGDSYAKIESARAGDEVVIAPGNYSFRVYLTAQGTASRPIVIRAQDPARPPVWDFGSTLVENAPGSYGAGDRGRGGWQFSGAKHYRVSGIVFRNCRTAERNSAGIRYYNGTINLYLKDCVFTGNDNGLTGGSQESEATVEFCEFATNGNVSASSPTHNLYIYGGTLTLRYCYVHDSVQAQNFHLRTRTATLEYNWFARAKSYEGDLMTDDDFSGTGPFSQTLTMRGNVIVQGTAPDNHSQVVALFNDTGLANLTLSVRAVHNTFIGNGGNAAFVHLSNADGTRMDAEEANNIIFGTTRPALIEKTNQALVTGVNNWLVTNAVVGSLRGSVQSATPGFRNSAGQDYRLTPNSVCLGAASGTVTELPGREYYLNEATNRQWRVRAAARDLGAYESTTTTQPVRPYDAPPQPRLSLERSGAGVWVRWPLFAQDYRLEQADWADPATWTAVGFPYATGVTGLSVSQPLMANGACFRLRR